MNPEAIPNLHFLKIFFLEEVGSHMLPDNGVLILWNQGYSSFIFIFTNNSERRRIWVSELWSCSNMVYFLSRWRRWRPRRSRWRSCRYTDTCRRLRSSCLGWTGCRSQCGPLEPSQVEKEINSFQHKKYQIYSFSVATNLEHLFWILPVCHLIRNTDIYKTL